jgi:hypothetical protein
MQGELKGLTSYGENIKGTGVRDTHRSSKRLLEVEDKEEDIEIDNYYIDNDENLVNEQITEVNANDYGFVSLFYSGDLCNNEFKYNKNIYINNTNNKQCEINLLQNISANNKAKKGKPSNKLQLLLHFAKKEYNNYSDFNLVDLPEVKERNRAKTLMHVGSLVQDDIKEEQFKNTVNSFINEQQNKLVEQNLMDDALLLNRQYKIVGEFYELFLIRNSIQKYEEYLELNEKGDGNIELEFEEIYSKLKETSLSLFQEYDSIFGKFYGRKMKIKQIEINNKAKNNLHRFIEGVIIKMREQELRSENAYLRWKKKISELVNIWDLFDSNGIEIKLPFKYLILYKFFNKRWKLKQEGKNLFCNLKFKPNTQIIIKKDLPVLFFFEYDKIGILFDILSTILLLYTLITIPLRLFLNNFDISVLSLIEKFVDTCFYINLMTNFRTGFKDKFNNDVINITHITRRYIRTFFPIDLLSSVPWSFFFISFDECVINIVKIVTNILKVLRVIRLLPIFNRLERIKGFAIHFRLLKLLIFYFLITHWFACILFYFINSSFSYSGLQDDCYYSNFDNSKLNLKPNCSYVISFYQASFIIPGQYTSYMSTYDSLIPLSEYVVLIFAYVAGQCISAYIFGGLTDILQNLDKCKNFFRHKTDLLREHMMFYEIDSYTQNDVAIYYDYLWQRHKDIIYGKEHFSLLSDSLREKFENMNLLNNEIYLSLFYKLGNPKLVGNILMNLQKLILLPYEILYEEGSVTPGIFIPLNGEIILENKNIKNQYNEIITVQPLDFTGNENSQESILNVKKEAKVFPLLSALIKTGRTYRRCYSSEFSDLFFFSLSAFDKLIENFPIEIHSLKVDIMKDVEQSKIFENEQIMAMLSVPSCRSVGSFYESKYNANNIWVPIPIPISQRKIARNYIESFVSKVRNQWREILTSGDLNICLQGVDILKLFKRKKRKKHDCCYESKKDNIDSLETLKLFANEVDELVNDFLNN